jgi:excisionase family DNA binding protein
MTRTLGIGIASKDGSSVQTNSTDMLAGQTSANPVVQLDLTLLASAIARRVVDDLTAVLAVPSSSPWLDVAGAADYLACSPERVRKLVQRREVPFHQERRGGRVFLNRYELDRWLSEK